MVKRVIGGLVAIFSLFTGLQMLFRSYDWYLSVAATDNIGPYNAHFIADVGGAFIASGLSLLVCCWRPVYWPAAMAGCGFLGLHAFIHVVESLQHPHQITSTVALSVLALLAIWCSWPGREIQHA